MVFCVGANRPSKVARSDLVRVTGACSYGWQSASLRSALGPDLASELVSAQYPPVQRHVSRRLVAACA